MAENKRLNTRLMLKYDTYANWTTNNPNLLKGEVAIAVIDVADNTQTHSGQAVPQLLMKVGNGLEGEPGKYNSLPFVSGLAADVHSWAKSASKPSYAISEISGAKEYQTVQGADEYTWILQARKAGSSDAWENVSTIDLAKISTRIKAVEDRMATAEGDIDKLEGTVGDSTKGLVKDVADLKAAVGEGGSVSDAITGAINGLDSTKNQAAGADGLALEVVQENGVIQSISGSIAANTYDKFGAAKEAVEALDATVSHTAGTDGLAVEITQVDGKLTGVTASIAANTYDAYGAASAAVEALDMTAAVEGTQEGTVVKFIDKVNQTNGLVEAELGELVFNSAYNAESNKAATMADVTGAVADLNGAMHFEGFTSTDPATGVTIEGKPDYVAAAGDVVIYNTVEYVYDGSKWQKLGEEGALGAAIEALDATVSIKDEGNTNPLNITIVETNGVLTSVTGSIDDVFDAKGTAANLIENLDATVSIEDTDNKNPLNITITEENGKLTSVTGSIDDVFDAKGAADAAVNALNLSEVAGVQTGTEIKFINKVSQANGAVSAEVGTLVVNTAYDATTNKIATMADITTAEGEVGEDIEALKNRVKANEDAITTLNGADTVANSVANKIKTAIEALDKADTAVEGQFVTSVSEENGIITVARSAVNIKDLEQTDNTYVVFDCGSSSVNI